MFVKITEELEENNEPDIYIHLFQGLPKAEKMEYIIQKGTEIGICEFTPICMERSIVKISEKDGDKKTQRWQKISETAAKQCKRGVIPKINKPNNLQNIYPIIKEYDMVLIAYEGERNKSLKQIIKQQRNNMQLNKIAIIIGPEGGLTKKEVESLEKEGGICITLGKRILRTETAPLLMAGILLYELEE